MAVAEIIAGAVALWDMFGKDMYTDEMEAGLKERWQQFGWKKAAQTYLERLYTEYSAIRPLGSSAPIELDKVFTDVYILSQPLAFKRFNIHQLHADPDLLDKTTERVPGLELVQRTGYERLFILGGPGAGKTTFLKYLTIQAAKNKIQKVPIFIVLKRWADSGLTLMDYLEREFEICNFPDARLFIKSILGKGRALVLFDGLDEIPQADEQRNKAIAVLHDFARQYYASPCLITCRRAAVEYRFEQFTYVELADFTPEQIRDMVTKWFVDDPEKSRLFLADFDRGENRGVRELARTPLLLTLLCLAFAQNASFPQRRVEIYHDAIEALLRKWDAERNIRRDDLLYSEQIYKLMSPDRKHQMLAEVAIRTFIAGTYFIDQETLEGLLAEYMRKLPGIDPTTDIDVRVLLRAIEAQHGILVTRAERIHSFAHLSFQEYFAAMAIKEEASARTFAQLFQRFLSDNRWREVFLLTASTLKEASVFLTMFRVAVDAFIAGDETLVAMAHWADGQAQATPVTARSEQVRRMYWSAVLDRASDRAFAGDLDLDLAIDLASARASDRARASASARDLASASDRASALARALARASASASDLASASARDLERDLANALDRDFANARTSDFRQLYTELTRLMPVVYTLLVELLEQVIAEPEYPLLRNYKLPQLVPDLKLLVAKIHRDPTPAMVQAFAAYLAALANWSKGSCYPDLDTALAALVVPGADADNAAWGAFVKQVEQLPEHIDRVIGWELSAEQAQRLEQYFQAVNLLEDCLDIAYAANRDEIRASLLLPPGAWQPGTGESSWGL